MLSTGHYLERLRELEPRVHGNGFIQCDLPHRKRLHIWGHPAIPRQKVSSPIHDHVFSFASIVLVGRLVNIVYKAVSNGEQGKFRL